MKISQNKKELKGEVIEESKGEVIEESKGEDSKGEGEGSKGEKGRKGWGRMKKD